MSNTVIKIVLLLCVFCISSLNALPNTGPRLITGTVSDTYGELMPGVTIVIKGTTSGTITDVNGEYSITVPSDESILEFTFIGFEHEEVVVGKRTIIPVTLRESTIELDEVAVVGFATQKKESVVASISSVKGTDLQIPTRSLSNALSGQLPGLISVQTSGEPGYDNSEFWIRGVSSFAGGTSPLVLVDGVPRNMNDIEPDEIETFTLLKDASATSVFGSEGANGVILITSKRGRRQATTMSYRGEASIVTPTRVPEYASSYDYLRFYNDRLKHDGNPPLFSEEELEKYRSGEDPDLYPSTDWYSALVKQHTYNTRHTLNFRGGSDRVRFFVSGAYFNETGIFKVTDEYNNNADLNRYNLRSNIDIDITQTTLLRVDLSGQYLQANRPSVAPSTIFHGFNTTPPHLVPPVYSDGTIPRAPGESLTPYTQLMETGYRKEWRTGIQSKINLEQKLDFVTPGLKARGSISYDSNSTYNMSRTKTAETFYAVGRDDEGALIFEQVDVGTAFGNPVTSSSGNKHVYLEGALDYAQNFGQHEVGGMALYYQKDNQLHNNALAFRKQAWVGRATYNFDNRYFIEGNFSVTGSEQFAAGYRYGFFPAVGIMWNITNEPFFPDHLKRTLSGIRLRTSLGKTGNDDTGAQRFLYRSTFSTSSINYGLGVGVDGPLNRQGTGLYEGRFEAPYLSWELEYKRNIGIDIHLFDGKIALLADYFNNDRTDILLQRRVVAAAAGFSQAPWQNHGKVNNKGVDASLNVYHTIGDFDFSFRGNYTFARNKIIEYDEIPQLHPWMAVTGTRLNAYNGLVAERLFTEDDFIITIDPSGYKNYKLRDGIAHFEPVPNPKPGDIKYVDQDGDGVVNSSLDLVRDWGHPTVPEIMYGFGMSTGYKNFYVSVFFQGAGNVSATLNRVAFNTLNAGLTRSNARKIVVDSRWTEENPSQNVFYPRVSDVNKYNTDQTNSTWWYRDASYIRLKNVELGYKVPEKVSSKLNMQQARLYVMGHNIHVWDKVKITDPESASAGGNTAVDGTYPLTRSWSLGLEITF